MSTSKAESRALIMAPVGRDAAAMATLLKEHGLESEICHEPVDACRKIAEGAGLLLLTEEGLELPQISVLLEQLSAQPPWSELPLIILTNGSKSCRVKLLDLAARAAGSVTLLERPVGMITLLRSVEVGLRSRSRQYQLRDLLEEERRKQRELMEAQQALQEAQKQLQQHANNLEQTVAERTQELRATNEQLEAFVYSIAHDLRAPLRSMIGCSQLLIDDYAAALAETAQNLLKRIQASGGFMDNLLLDLLAYGRTARSEMALEPVKMRTAWDTALFQNAAQIEQLGANIETIEPLGTVLAHEATLGQCLSNLLSNALKFVAPGVQPVVRCRAEEREDYVRVWVEDNGIGIPARHHERIFRVFERLNGGQYPGTGIGLSIVHKGVERMGGRVGVNSDSGQGSRFWIELRKES